MPAKALPWMAGQGDLKGMILAPGKAKSCYDTDVNFHMC
jgi:hypothetical protein